MLFGFRDSKSCAVILVPRPPRPKVFFPSPGHPSPQSSRRHTLRTGTTPPGVCRALDRRRAARSPLRSAVSHFSPLTLFLVRQTPAPCRGLPAGAGIGIGMESVRHAHVQSVHTHQARPELSSTPPDRSSRAYCTCKTVFVALATLDERGSASKGDA